MSSWGPAVVKSAHRCWALLGFRLSAPKRVLPDPTCQKNCALPWTDVESRQSALGHVGSPGQWVVRNCPPVSHQPGAAANMGVGVHFEKSAKI